MRTMIVFLLAVALLNLPAEDAVSVARENETQLDIRVNALLDAIVAAPQSDAAAQARAELRKLGTDAAPALAARLFEPNTLARAEVRDALERMPKNPGKPVAGVTLSAVAAGRPRSGEALPVWITLTNHTDGDLWFLEHNWSLYAKSSSSNQGRGKMGGAVPWELSDFSVLKAGQSRGELMDAIPFSDSRGAGQICVYLQITVALDAGKGVVPGKVFTSGDWLESQYFAVRYSAQTPDPPHMEHVRALGNAKERAGAELALTKAGAAAIPALRRGLRLAEDDDRWRVFDFACRQAFAEMEQDILDFWGRWGNNWTFGRTMHGEAVLNFSKGLPPERRLEFLDRAVQAQPQNSRALMNIASELSPGTEAEKQQAWTYLKTVYDRGDREYSRLNFLAWRYGRGDPPARRDAKLALKIGREAVQAKEDYWDAWHTLAVILMDAGELEEAAKCCERAMDLKYKDEYRDTRLEIYKKLGREAPKRAQKGEDF